nr:protein giant-like [Onthophagus taurus]
MEYFGYNPNIFAIKQDLPLNLASKKEAIRYHPYENVYSQECFQEISVKKSPSYTSDSESFVSSSSHERLSLSPLNNGLDIDYQRFREEHLSKLPQKIISNHNMRRIGQSIGHHHQQIDPSYKEKREKNNLAAKKSRDARKLREDEMVLRCAFLESELMKSSLTRKQHKICIEEENETLKKLDLILNPVKSP